MKLKNWFNDRYNSLADKTARERLQIRKLKKLSSFHDEMARSLHSYHRNDTNRQKRIVDQRMVELLP